MQGRFVSGLIVLATALPAFVVAEQTTPPAPQTATPSPAPSVAAIPAPAPVPPVTPPAAPVSPETEIKMGGGTPSGPLAPLPKFELDLPPSMTPPAPQAPLPPLMPPAPKAPPAKLTPTQIAQQIAPNFNVQRDYVRLTQCYGVADFMGAVTRIQASRPGATPQVINVARSIAALQDGMQPMVLAASTVRTEARFRADYDAIARRGQQELATSRTPNVTMQRRLATLDACRADVVRWRGGR
jgi:hypothetical protein